MSVLSGKHIVLGISGGIAAYKSAFLARLLVKAGAEVQVIMTPAAKEFITPLTLSTLTGKPVISEFFTANTGEWHSHVDLGLWADIFLVAPATACTIGKMATGIADNMLVTSYLSTRAQRFVAPAMDLDMYSHPSTHRNLDTLRADGVEIIEPADGFLASGLSGKGRMEEPENIVKALEAALQRNLSLTGKKILITAGPTHEKIDPVRFIGNCSSGKMGFAIALEAEKRGADVTLISGPVALTLPSKSRIKRIDVESAREMYDATTKAFPETDVAILSAAVADFAPRNCADSKIKRAGIDTMTLELVKNPDIAASLGERKTDKQRLVGFALETDREEENALGKMKRKNLDAIVLNSLRDPLAGFGKDTNKVTIFRADGSKRSFPAKSKADVAIDILDSIFND